MKDKIAHILETADFANAAAMEECERRIEETIRAETVACAQTVLDCAKGFYEHAKGPYLIAATAVSLRLKI